ncbi:MAG: hypothetical protein MZW92_28495 [Comamonadaceae bacterium]|nr:hypothetical protein [Comamonadaceae bacterium]
MARPVAGGRAGRDPSRGRRLRAGHGHQCRASARADRRPALQRRVQGPHPAAAASATGHRGGGAGVSPNRLVSAKLAS